MTSENMLGIQDGERRRWYRLGYQAVVLIVVLWVLQFAMTTVRQNLWDGTAPGRGPLSRRAIVCVGGAFLFYAIGMALERLRQGSFALRVAVAFPIAVIGAVVHGGFNALIFDYLYPLPSARPYADGWEVLTGIYINVHYWLWGFLAWATIYLALSYSREVAERDQRLRQFQALAHSAQLRALRYQVNPHFLFNALNAASSLVTGGQSDRAEAVLANLSDFLRASLATDPLEDIPLWREIEYERLYLDIELVRFPDRLRVEIDLPDAVRDALVPSLILQPLIENAIKHAVSATSAPVTIRMVVRGRHGRLTIVVSDDGPPGAPATDSRGVGLANVRQRLMTKFPDTAAFTAGPRHPQGFGVELSLPLRTA